MSSLNPSSSTSSEKKSAKPAKRRTLTGVSGRIVAILAIGLAIFQLYTAFFGLLPSMQQRSLHIAFIFPLVYLLYPATAKSSRQSVVWYDWLCAAIMMACTLYIFIRYDDVALRGGLIYDYEIGLAAIFTILIFEAGRRVLGYPLPFFCFLFLLFAYFGQSLPGPFQHFGLSVPRILEELYLTTDGFFGLVAGVSATYIFLFVLFGAFLQSTKTSEFFNNISMALAGHYKGGPAKIAVISSALMGTISGSTSANVATTGAFTIPLMKGIGYPPHFAGAVEAAASTGGQIMPPVMGAAAFIIADTLGIRYTTVLISAIVPAILYFWGIWCSLSLEAARLGLKGLPKETLPKARKVLVESGYKSIPLFVIVYFLVQGYNPLYAGCWGIISSIVLSFVKKADRLTVKAFFTTLEEGSKSAISVATACVIVGVVIGMLGATGIALRIGDSVLSITQGLLIPTLGMTMFIALLLGMGMPTTASYVMGSAVAAPAMVLLGINPLDAHMFVFFYAVLSSVTPPVCTGAYTAAGIAGSAPNQTAFTSVKLALPGFIVPFIFVLAPEILLTNVTSWFTTIQAMLSAILGVFLLSCATGGYMMSPLRYYERLLALCGALGLLYPGTITDVAGLGIAALLFAISRVRSRAAEAVAA